MIVAETCKCMFCKQVKFLVQLTSTCLLLEQVKPNGKLLPCTGFACFTHRLYGSIFTGFACYLICWSADPAAVRQSGCFRDGKMLVLGHKERALGRPGPEKSCSASYRSKAKGWADLKALFIIEIRNWWIVFTCQKFTIILRVLLALALVSRFSILTTNGSGRWRLLSNCI